MFRFHARIASVLNLASPNFERLWRNCNKNIIGFSADVAFQQGLVDNVPCIVKARRFRILDVGVLRPAGKRRDARGKGFVIFRLRIDGRVPVVARASPSCRIGVIHPCDAAGKNPLGRAGRRKRYARIAPEKKEHHKILVASLEGILRISACNIIVY